MAFEEDCGRLDLLSCLKDLVVAFALVGRKWEPAGSEKQVVTKGKKFSSSNFQTPVWNSGGISLVNVQKFIYNDHYISLELSTDIHCVLVW